MLPVGRLFFAVGLIGLGVEHFIFKRFVTGRAPAWPEAWPGGFAVAYLSGVLVISLGVAIVARRHTRLVALLTAVAILLGALLRHVPVVVSSSLFGGAWTPAGKALTFVGAALAIAATSPSITAAWNERLLRLVNLRGEFILIARVCVGVFLANSGVQHFMFTPFVVTLIPSWFPGDAVFWARFAGVALIAGGIGLWVPRLAPLAALLSGVMVFSWLWIVHIPRTFVSVSDGIAVFEALAVSGIAFVLAGSLLENRAAASR